MFNFLKKDLDTLPQHNNNNNNSSEEINDNSPSRTNGRSRFSISSIRRGNTGWREVWIDQPSRNKRFRRNRVTNSKYTLLTFLPLNLLEQFGRFMNRYFLLIACLQLIRTVTPVSPATTWFPLAFIFTVSAVKEALDDYQRHKADRIANRRKYQIIRKGKEMTIQSQHIRVGDIIRIENDSELPCDLVLLQSAPNREKAGMCYIQTSNIDGETDLKARYIPGGFVLSDFADIPRKRLRIQCPHPNNHIYAFDATLTMNETGGDASDNLKVYSLNPKNLLLQGTFLRNSGYIYGVAVYTGRETKLGMNKCKPEIKLTQLDVKIDRGSGFIFAFQIIMVFIFGLIGNLLATYKFLDKHSYLDIGSELAAWYHYFLIPFRMLLLFSIMIPISLKVSLDVVKFLSSKFITWDLKIYNEELDEPTIASNTSIAEELGQIQYIFTDKTGTLTENQMIFRKCSIDGTIYGARNQQDIVNNKDYDISDDRTLQETANQTVTERNSSLYHFLNCLTLCHTVVPTPEKNTGKTVFIGSSPDEEALVHVMSKLGFVFNGKVGDKLSVSLIGQDRTFTLLQMLEFSSERKRMSVFVQDDETDEIFLYSKGSDDVIIGSCSPGPNRDKVIRDLEEFAKMGFRTLCVAYRKIEAKEYEMWLENFQTANAALENREMKVLQCYSDAEKGLQLLGATAIEDSLQKHVPHTISQLRKAGLKIWMLTGDKRGTAVQIARSCELFEDSNQMLMSEFDESKLIHLDASGKSYVEMKRIIEEHISRVNSKDNRNSESQQPKNFFVIIDGATIRKIFDDNSCTQRFIDLAQMAQSVVCCRVSPYQKSAIVDLIKQRGMITLAIGDGGNDVAMIQKAHVGVGIKGREGFQAARASDYSIAQFSYLARLLLIHGRYSYKRTAFVALYCFYKSIYIGLMQAMFETHCGFSGTSFFSAFSLSLYNVVFTGMPIVFYVLDKDIKEQSVYQFPDVYQENISGIFFNKEIFVLWLSRAFFQSGVTFFLAMYLYSYDRMNAYGPTIDESTTAMLAYSCAVMIQNFTVIFASSNLTWVNNLVIGGSMALFFIITTVAATFPLMDIYGVNEALFSDINYWLLLIFILCTALLPLVIAKYYRVNYFPRYFEKIQALELNLYKDVNNDHSIEMTPTSSSELGSTREGRSDSISSAHSDTPLTGTNNTRVDVGRTTAQQEESSGSDTDEVAQY